MSEEFYDVSVKEIGSSQKENSMNQLSICSYTMHGMHQDKCFITNNIFRFDILRLQEL